MSGEITVYDIAKMAGVSVATVSRVINNYPYVNKNTRSKVMKIITETGFVLNSAARSLATKSTKMVGILISDMRTTHHTEGIFFIQQEFSKKGYSCIIYNTGSDPEEMAHHIQILSQRQVDAAVLMGSVFQNEPVRKAIETNLPTIPVAICNGYLEGPNIYGVLSDERFGIMQAMKILSDKGHKHFACISNGPTPSNLEKIEGFKSGMKLYVQGGSSHIVDIPNGSMSDIQEATRKLMNEYPEIDAFVYSEDLIAIAGIRELSLMGKKIPDDVAVFGLNNSRFSRICNPSLSTVDNMLHDMSLVAVRNLLGVLKGEDVNHKMSICAKVVERESS